MISSGSGGARAAIIFDASDKTGAAFDSLQKRLAGAQVQLKGDRAVRYERVAQAMAAVQQAGLRQIGFITERR